ncbi:uncharacterized protein LOC135090935 [Scylla paramamosain]|uniref:uncharacterized protein LOC135090935 n=1 Tax=Scylla paramamosain TaxID=85552 RepID=UPI0030835BB2
MCPLVLAFLTKAATQRKFHVIVAERAPKYDGHPVAKALCTAGIETTLIQDCSVPHHVTCQQGHQRSSLGCFGGVLGCFFKCFEGRRRRDIGASLTEAWEVINPRALFSVSCVKGLGREAWS